MANRYRGRGQLIKRLAAQVGSKDLALGILHDRGHAFKNGNLTKAGQARDDMTSRERALDRASKASGRPTSDYKYSSKTNRTKLKDQ